MTQKLDQINMKQNRSLFVLYERWGWKKRSVGQKMLLPRFLENLLQK